MSRVSLDFDSRLSSAAFSIGVCLCAVGLVGSTMDLVSSVPVSGPGIAIDLDLEFLGVVAGLGAVASDRTGVSAALSSQPVSPTDERQPVYITRPLLETLLETAHRAEPESVSIGLAVTPASRISSRADIPESMPVFTHFYLPKGRNSVSTVFGMELQIPPTRTHGRFVTHPLSELRLTKRDDLHGIVFVAVPPWDGDSIAAFDRFGRRCPMRVIDAVPPDEPLPGENH